MSTPHQFQPQVIWYLFCLRRSRLRLRFMEYFNFWTKLVRGKGFVPKISVHCVLEILDKALYIAPNP